jgi:hypothetical protein
MKVLFDMPSKGHSDYGEYSFKDGAQSFLEGAFMAGSMVLTPVTVPGMIMPVMTGNFQYGPFSYDMTEDQWSFGWGPVDYNMTSKEWDYMFEKGNTVWENIQYGTRSISDIQRLTDLTKGFLKTKLAQNNESLMSSVHPWDLNGDNKLSKYEADTWWLVSGGKDIWVDNSKIDWSGLELPSGYSPGQIYSLETIDAFLMLPFETAATYGGISFEIIDQSVLKVLSEYYHYNFRKIRTIKDFGRNILTRIGAPIGHKYGRDFYINFYNPTINLD